MKKKYKEIFFAAWTLCSMLIVGYLIWKNGWNLVNSDDTAELILAKLLSEGNGVVSKGWMYSTELRVINTQLIRALLFRITDNWTTVRIVGNIILDLWFLASYAFFIRQFIGKESWSRWFWYTAPFLLAPFSGEAFYVYGLMAYYIPYMALSFPILGLCVLLYRREREKRLIVPYILLAAVSFGAALGGIRQLLITEVPLVMALFFLILRHSELLRDWKGFLSRYAAVFWSCLWGIAGYLFNTRILAGQYHFKSYNELHLIQPTMERLQVILRGILNVFGYTEGDVPETLLFSEKGILLVLSLGFMVFLGILLLLIWKSRNSLSELSEYIFWFSGCGFAICFLLFLFTDVEITPRYYLLNIMMFVPLMAVFYRETTLSTEVRKLLYGAAVIWVMVLSVGVYKGCLHRTDNVERMEVTRYLLENDDSYGYATFWNADIMTELSDGTIEMAAIEGEEGNYSLFPWLVKLDTLFPQETGKQVFLMLHENERNRFKGLCEDREAIFETDHYYIYTYENTDEFSALLNQE